MFRESFRYNGKRYDIRAKTETDLAVKIALRKKELEEGKETVDGNTLVSVWGQKWLVTHKKNDVSISWYKTLEGMFNGIINPAIGDIKIKDVRPINLKKILNQYKGYSRSYQKKIRDLMHEMFEDARKNRMILENPAVELGLPESKAVTKRRSITDYEREHILKVCETHRGNLFMKIMLYCGLRPSEVTRLQWKDINLKGRTLKVTGKTKTPAGNRTVPIPDSLLNQLVKGEPFDFICTTEDGNQHSKQSVDRLWRSFKRDLNISMGCETYRNKVLPPYRVADDLVMYNLRHTYCTDLEKAGIPINIARVLMGHSKISITAEIYTHADSETYKDALDKINKYSTGGKGGGKDVSNR